MNFPTASNPMLGGLNGTQPLPNWNWNMRAFPPQFLPTPNNYGDLSSMGNFGSMDGISHDGGMNGGNTISKDGTFDKSMYSRQGNMSMNHPILSNPNFPIPMNLPPNQQQQLHQQMISSQQYALQQQAIMNKLGPMSQLMFPNANAKILPQMDIKTSDLTSLRSNESNTLQYSVKKERLSPLPSWFPGSGHSFPGYQDTNNISASMALDPVGDIAATIASNGSEIHEPLPLSSTMVSGINSNNQRDSMMSVNSQQVPPYLENSMSNPMTGFWGGNFMYGNPSNFPQFPFNQNPAFAGNSNHINPNQMIGNPFRFPNTQFNPFMNSTGMAAAALHNNYFPPNIQQQQQQALFQQQHEQFLALANQQQMPMIKQENEMNYPTDTPNIEEHIKLEDDNISSSHTEDDDSDKLVKPRKSSKCQCPNCTNPLQDDENAKIVKKHACHWLGCIKTYGKTSHLKSHIRQHQGIRPFICPDPTCLKSFTRSDELSRHTRIHTNERRFNCTSCPKGFTRSDHLKKHEKTHRGHTNEGELEGTHSVKKSLNRVGKPKKKRLLNFENSYNSSNVSTDLQTLKSIPSLNGNGTDTVNLNSQPSQNPYNFGSPGTPIANVNTTGVVPRRGRPPKNKKIQTLKAILPPLQKEEVNQKPGSSNNINFSQSVDNLINSVLADCTSLNQEPFGVSNTPIHNVENIGMETPTNENPSIKCLIKTEENDNNSSFDIDEQEHTNFQSIQNTMDGSPSPFNSSMLFSSPLLMYNQSLDYHPYITQPFAQPDV